MLAIAHLLNGLLMIAIPLALGAVLARRRQLSWSFFGAGAVTFIASQIFHIPFNYLILTPFVTSRGMVAAGGIAFVAAALLYGLSAGVFEEVARYIAMRRWPSEARRVSNALMFGAGHGGGEAIILGVGVLIGFFQAVALRGVDLSATISPAKVESTALQLAQYWGIPWYQALLGALERVGALCFHLSASVLVLQSVRRSQWVWLAGAIAWHALFNAVVLIAMDQWGIYAAEATVMIGAGISLFILWRVKDQDVADDLAGTQSVSVQQESPAVQRNYDEDVTTGNLEDSRYSRER